MKLNVRTTTNVVGFLLTGLILFAIFAASNNGIVNQDAQAQTIAVKHLNFTATGTALRLDLGVSPANVVIFQNLDATNTAQISFNDGASWFTLKVGQVYRFDKLARRHFHHQRSAGVNVNVECISW